VGKGGKPKVEVTEYSMSEHFGICSGPVDAITRIIVKEKTAWEGSQSTLGTTVINLPELFGGVKKEGGLKGLVTFLPGDADQLMPIGLAQKLGRSGPNDCPAFRGISSLFFYGNGRGGIHDIDDFLFAKLGKHQGINGFYWTANTPFLPGVWATVRRAPVGLDPGLALIPRSSSTAPLIQTVDLNAVTNGGLTSAVGVTISGFSPDDVIELTQPAGGLYTAFCYAGEPNFTANANSGSANGFSVERDGGALTELSFGDVFDFDTISNAAMHDGYEAARAAFGSATMTGASSYTFYIYDTESANNEGGLSIRAKVIGDADANPAHIIYECLTNIDWGMGSPAAAIDTTSFEDAAATLYGEGFGLSMIWTRQAIIQDFVQEVLDHIQAVLFVDPATGLLTLKLIRDDYDAESLPVIDPDNADLSNFNRKLWGEIVNEIVVTWTNPENEQEETITAQDLASIATQGGVVSDSRNYYGVRNAALAQDLAYRDLRSAGQPLASCEAELDRTQWNLRPASVVKLTWPEYGLSEVVMRVTSIDYGRPGDMTIKVSLVEDVYGLDIGSYDSPPSTEWEDPSAPPEAMETVQIFTLPLFFAADTTVSAFVDSPEYPEVLAGVLATTDQEDAFSYELWDELALPNGDLEWESLGTNNIIGRGELVAALDAEAMSVGVLFENVVGLTTPSVGGFLIIGTGDEATDEIAMVDVDNGDVYGLDVVRGVLDTIPRAWPAGTPVWFVDGNTLFEDSEVRAAGETVDYKLLTRTSQGLLSLDDASLESATLSERPWLPNRPANVTAYGEAWSSETDVIDARDRADPWVTVTWANRNRLTEDSQVLGWTDSDVTPEDGQTTTILVLPPDSDTPITTHDGLTGTSFDVPDASFGSYPVARLHILAERSDTDGDFVSLQYFEHWVQVGTITADTTIITADNDGWTADEG